MIHFHKKDYRIGLDIDEVLAGFLDAYWKDKGYRDFKHFYFSYSTGEELKKFSKDWWLNLPPKIDGGSLPFMPKCYISSRNFDVKITEEWLEKNNFPCVPVIHVDGSKAEAAKKMNINIYVDDFINNFQELHAAGVETFLMDCNHNRQYDVGDYRLMSLLELPKKIIQLGL